MNRTIFKNHKHALSADSAVARIRNINARAAFFNAHPELRAQERLPKESPTERK